MPNIAELVENTSAAVVNVSVIKTVKTQSRHSPFPGSPRGFPFDDFFNFPFEEPKQERERKISSGGSGFIISKDGYILTNHHVVAEATEIIISLNDRREFKANLIGSDEKSDVALLKINTNEALPYLSLGNSDEIRVGDWVVAIGSPYRLNFSVTAGIVSAKSRSIPDQGTSYIPFIQSDVAINPGNSGGPLFNLKGEVIGINAMIYSSGGGYMGISFTIPINYASEIIDQLKNDGVVSRGWLGVSVQEVTKDLADSFKLGNPRGALIGNVLKDSPAERAGLKNGDVILSFNKQKIIYSGDLPLIVGRIKPDTTVDAVIFRSGIEKKMRVKVGVLEEIKTENTIPAAEDKIDDLLGLKLIPVKELSSEKVEQLKVESGVFVEEVKDGPAKDAGIQIGDVITTMAFKEVSNLEDYNSILSE
ncbi:MAG: Do family serine endopeptidase, partial [Pseudomonadota bacterium]|nr:Do family serine endopeptidase [Pseudomonadota bacterium]